MSQPKPVHADCDVSVLRLDYRNWSEIPVKLFEFNNLSIKHMHKANVFNFFKRAFKKKSDDP